MCIRIGSGNNHLLYLPYHHGVVQPAVLGIEAVDALTLIRKLLNRVMIWCATGRFRFIQEWSQPPDARVRVMHFAESERDFNTACRQRVEWLDERRPAQHEETELEV